MRAALSIVLLSCGANPPPDCLSPLPSQFTSDMMHELDWHDATGCVQFTYDPVFRARQAAVVEAARAWIDRECRTTCFALPIERATAEDGRPDLQNIHLISRPPGNEPTSVAFWYRAETGQIDRALVKVDATLIDPIFDRALLRGFGKAIGFDAPGPTVESILDPTDDLSEPSAEDGRAFCSKYGTCL